MFREEGGGRREEGGERTEEKQVSSKGLINGKP